MTNQDLANLLFPDAKDVSYYEEKYPERNLKEGAIVTRFAPSPTGFVHMGSLYTTFLGYMMAKQSGGVYYLRVEDTDQKREVENGIEGIFNDLKAYDFEIQEGYGIGGDYGPYLQSERKEIYQAYAKSLIAKGLAYPCFCSAEEIEEMRKVQEESKERIGYYGSFANCRNLSVDEAYEKVKSGASWVIRLKSQGDFTRRHIFHDVIKGDVEYLENDMDIVIIKGDGLPTYHFAHAVDDHLMHTTHVIRGDEWLSSLPIHLELFDLLGFKRPEYGHVAPLTKKDGDTIRKLSKRKDPECSVKFYQEMGLPPEAIKLYLSMIGNTNFEEWYLANLDKTYRDFPFSFEHMPIGGTLFDTVKMFATAKLYFSTISAKEIMDGLLPYTEKYDPEFYALLKNNPDYMLALLNIERNCERPRKDIGCYKDVKEEFWYMYDELFSQKENPYEGITGSYYMDDIKEYLETVYDEKDEQQDWFQKVKDFAGSYGYATNRKDYKANPEAFKGDVAKFCEGLRVMLTASLMSPNLYDLLKIYGKERLLKRFLVFREKVGNAK